MDYSKYKNPVEYPKKPIKPSLPISASPQHHRDYANALENYEAQMVLHDDNMRLWRNNETIRNNTFEQDAIDEVGLNGHPLAQRAFSYAWDEGHYAGFTEVFSKLTRIADVILGDTEKTPKVENKVRELILKRIAEMKRHENNFGNKNRYGEFSTGTIKADASEIMWEELNDNELVFLFERLVKRYNVQM